MFLMQRGKIILWEEIIGDNLSLFAICKSCCYKVLVNLKAKDTLA